MSFRNIFLQALFASMACHLIILSFFSFRMPLINITPPPFINFLGSFLEPYDTQNISEAPPVINIQDNQIIKLSVKSKNNQPLKAEAVKSPASQYLPLSAKKTLPGLTIISSSPSVIPQEQNKEEVFEHVPLKLPKNDRY